MKYVLVPIAEGTEEIEAVCIIDTLRRADINVTVASVGNQLEICASRGTKLIADTTINGCTTKLYDMIALPGGMPGATHLANCEPLIAMLHEQRDAGRSIAAICAAPAVVLKAHGLLGKTMATCYPSMQDQLDPRYCSTDGIVNENNLITGQGPGFSLKFSLELVEHLLGHEKRKAVGKAMLVDK
ncbi:MAG: DJ-1/PfpI family protein [Planctomycetes bacterium]|nr:DJ-1/PfpI family protein [Planctomycetota bacterium]